MQSPYFTVLNTLCGVVTGALLTCPISLWLAKGNARREAGRRLREAFAAELATLDRVWQTPKTIAPKDRFDVEGFLQKAWPKHHAAVSELAFHLPPSKRTGLEAAWRDYYEVGGIASFHNYYMGDNPGESFREKIAAIVKFS